MTFLSAANVLPLAGYDVAHSDASRALLYAEAVIEAHTGLIFGVAQTLNQRVVLSAKSYFLAVPKDTQSVVSITPALKTGYSAELQQNGYWLLDSDGLSFPWSEGVYKLELSRGFGFDGSNTPELINKAASLYVDHFFRLSDAERSRYAAVSTEHFAGSMRLFGTPVPEAQALLNKYARPLEVTLL